jgi:uncharacterized protein YodC (DUF2158 family)
MQIADDCLCMGAIWENPGRPNERREEEMENENEEMGAGTLVQLKSGGPVMTVESMGQKHGMRCVWFDGPELKGEDFSKASLNNVTNAHKMETMLLEVLQLAVPEALEEALKVLDHADPALANHVREAMDRFEEEKEGTFTSVLEGKQELFVGPTEGADAGDVFKQACALANAMNMTVAVSYDYTLIRVEPGDDPAEKKEAWIKASSEKPARESE